MHADQLDVLLVEDDEEDYLLTRDVLSEIDSGRYRLEWAPSYDDALVKAAEKEYDVWLVDYRLGHQSGVDLVREAVESGIRAPMILLTGQGDHRVDLAGMQAGAADFLTKYEINASLLERSIRYAIQHKRDKEALKRERDFISAILDSAGALVMLLDPHGAIVKFNWFCELTTGYSFDEVKGRAFWKVFVQEVDTGAIRSIFRNAQPGQFPNQYEGYWLTKAGRRRLITWSNTALTDDQGQVEYVVCVGVDITQRKQAQSALAYISKAVESIDEAIGITDATGRSIYHNRALRELSGYSVDQLNAAGGPEKLYVNPDISREILDTIQTGRPWVGPVELRTREGDVVPVTLKADGIQDDEGNTVGLVGIHSLVNGRSRI